MGEDQATNLACLGKRHRGRLSTETKRTPFVVTWPRPEDLQSQRSITQTARLSVDTPTLLRIPIHPYMQQMLSSAHAWRRLTTARWVVVPKCVR